MIEQVGRELDALVAEKVMGWQNVACLNGGNVPTGEPDDDWNRDARNDPRHGHTGMPQVHRVEVPDYSMQIADAWLVVEKLRELGWTCFLDNDDNQHDCEFARMGNQPLPYRSIDGRGKTAPLAICLAALNAVGYKGTP